MWNGQQMKKLPSTFPSANSATTATTTTGPHITRGVPPNFAQSSPQYHHHHRMNEPITPANPIDSNYYLQDRVAPHATHSAHSTSAPPTLHPLRPTRHTNIRGEVPQRDFITNPFNTTWQRVKFYLTPISAEHRSLAPKFFNLELTLSRAYNRAKRWVQTRHGAHVVKAVLQLGVVYALYRVGSYYYHLPKLVELPNYEYQPELPTRHIPYRGALLPHTLPNHLSGADSLFVKEFVEAYPQEGEIDRGEYMRQRAPPKMGLGRTPARLYLNSLDGFGERFDGRQIPYVQHPEQKGQEFLEDQPPQIDNYHIQTDSPYRKRFRPPERFS